MTSRARWLFLGSCIVGFSLVGGRLLEAARLGGVRHTIRLTRGPETQFLGLTTARPLRVSGHPAGERFLRLLPGYTGRSTEGNDPLLPADGTLTAWLGTSGGGWPLGAGVFLVDSHGQYFRGETGREIVPYDGGRAYSYRFPVSPRRERRVRLRVYDYGSRPSELSPTTATRCGEFELENPLWAAGTGVRELPLPGRSPVGFQLVNSWLRPGQVSWTRPAAATAFGPVPPLEVRGAGDPEVVVWLRRPVWLDPDVEILDATLADATGNMVAWKEDQTWRRGDMLQLVFPQRLPWSEPAWRLQIACAAGRGTPRWSSGPIPLESLPTAIDRKLEWRELGVRVWLRRVGAAGHPVVRVHLRSPREGLRFYVRSPERLAPETGEPARRLSLPGSAAETHVYPRPGSRTVTLEVEAEEGRIEDLVLPPVRELERPQATPE